MNKISHFPIHEATRAIALERLARFITEAGQAYTRIRNMDFGPAAHDNVSQLSPFIRHRLITELEVLEAVLAHHRFVDAEKFVHEVFWRGYFKGYLEAYPEIWQHYLTKRDQHVEALKNDDKLAFRYHTALSGQTGIDCFDAWVTELVETGYLHNHARMWFASIWIFTLRLPWELGADFTLRHFLDGDPASNTLSWRWVGGLHTKGKTYLARPSNIAEFTNGRFSPKGLATEAPPLSEPPMVRSAPFKHQPLSAAPSGPTLLLLTGEDLHPESLACGAADIQHIVGWQGAAGRSCLPVSQPVLTFSDSALRDGVIRASAHFKAKHDIIGQLTTDALMQIAKVHNLKTILIPHATVGPAADQITAIAPQLAEHQIELLSLKRREDQRIWPHATKGFFEVKQNIPRILHDLSIRSK